jgi:hypothetical protein
MFFRLCYKTLDDFDARMARGGNSAVSAVAPYDDFFCVFGCASFSDF